MRLVVENGTGKNADVRRAICVGGKTGTAEKVAGRRYDAQCAAFLLRRRLPDRTSRATWSRSSVDEPQATKATHGFATGGWIAAPVVGRESIAADGADRSGWHRSTTRPADESRTALLVAVSGEGRRTELLGIVGACHWTNFCTGPERR